MILMNSSLGLVNLGFKVFSSITDEFKRPNEENFDDFYVKVTLTKLVLVNDLMIV